jgi:hypothetical protein
MKSLSAFLRYLSLARAAEPLEPEEEFDELFEEDLLWTTERYATRDRF